MTGAPLAWRPGRVDGTPWQGIRYLSIDLQPGTEFPAVVTVHLNRPVGSLAPEHVAVRGGRRLAVPPYDMAFASRTIELRFRGLGDHSPYTVELLDGGGHALHPFFATAEFRFTIDCDVGDCRPPTAEARRTPAQPPAVDLLTKDFNGFVALLTDWVKVRNPQLADLSGASFERILVDLLAWAGDMASYHQDRVALEAFVETASQRRSLRQHAVLLGSRVNDGRAPETALAFDVRTTGFVPAGLQVRMRTSPDEVPVSFTVAKRTRVVAEHSSDRLRLAAFPGADDAVLPAGATEALLWGHEPELRAGDRLAFVQGSFAQVVTVAEAPAELEAAGWVAHPSQPFDPTSDPPAAVTQLRWAEPLAQDVRPWDTPPLVLHGNIVDARYGTPRRATLGPVVRRDEVPIALTRRTSVVTRRSVGEGFLLRALRVPEWPVVHDDGGECGSAPAVHVTVSGERWTAVDHLHASTSSDMHYTAEADEDGAVWLHFGDGVHGREVAFITREQPVAPIELDYRLGDPVAGNVGLGTLVDVVRPGTGADDDALEELGELAVTNVLAAAGGREPHTLARVKEELPSSLLHGPLQRAVTLEDYATVAMAVEGAGRATARTAGGLFNTVFVLVDPEGTQDLDERLRRRVHDAVDRLRMTGREHVVLAAEYVPLEVKLVLCVQPGFPRHLVRDRVLAELRPGFAARPGWFHPDRVSFGDTVRLGDVLALVQGIAGVRSVRATRFRPLGDPVGPEVHDVISLGRTKVARLDADADFPENGTLEVHVEGLDAEPGTRRVEAPAWRVTAISRRERGEWQGRITAVGGVRPDGATWRMTVPQAISAIRRGERMYVEEPAGDAVEVTVSHTSEGREYLRTEADADAPNNLLSLPELDEEDDEG